MADIRADSSDQLVNLVQYLCQKWLLGDGLAVCLDEFFPAYVGQERELYDCIIASINEHHVKRGDSARYPRAANIFNGMAGLTLTEREATAPIGTVISSLLARLNQTGVATSFTRLVNLLVRVINRPLKQYLRKL